MPDIDRQACETFLLRELIEITGDRSVTPAKGFHALGGSSLRAILLASAIEVEYGVAIGLADVLESGSVHALSALVADAAACARAG